MKRLLVNIASYTMFLLLVWSGIAFTHPTEALPSPAESLIFELINAARHDPLAMAEHVGWTRDQVLANFPHMRQMLLSGLPPLRYHAALYAAAAGHGQDMLQNAYYAFVARDGRHPLDRLREQGYDAVFSDETLGLISFGRYIDQLTVAALFFQNLYRDELDPAWQGARNILNPTFRDAGISIHAGVIHLGTPLNVYVLTADFGVRREYLAGLRLLQQLNAIRREPLPWLRAMGIDENLVRIRLGAQSWILDYGLPPLAWNNILYRVAQGHTEDMAGRVYFGSVTPEGLEPLQRFAGSGYFTLYGSELLNQLCLDTAHTPESIASIFIHNFMVDSLLQHTRTIDLLLSPKLTEVGVGFAAGAGLCNDMQQHLLLTIDIARADRPQAFVLGNIYRLQHLAESDLPAAAVAYEGAGVEIYSAEGSLAGRSFTGMLGEYQVPLPQGAAEVRVLDAQGQILTSYFIQGEGQNILLDIHLEQ